MGSMDRTRKRRTEPDSPLRNIRRARTMSQGVLASLAGVSQRFISMAERGERQPSHDLQVRIATILGSTTDALFPNVSRELVA